MPDALDLLCRYKLNGSFLGQSILTTLWFRSKETADPQDQQAFLDGLMNEIEIFLLTNYLNCCTSDYEATDASLEILSGGLPYQTIRSYVGRFGLHAPQSLPPHDAQLLSLYTGFHGRRLHGRLYLPAIGEADQDAGRLSSTAFGRLDTFGALLVSRFGSVGSSPFAWVCVFSRKNGVQRVPVPIPHLVYDVLAANPVTRYVAHQVIATQRHRRIGIGT